MPVITNVVNTPEFSGVYGTKLISNPTMLTYPIQVGKIANPPGAAVVAGHPQIYQFAGSSGGDDIGRSLARFTTTTLGGVNTQAALHMLTRNSAAYAATHAEGTPAASRALVTMQFFQDSVEKPADMSQSYPADSAQHSFVTVQSVTQGALLRV